MVICPEKEPQMPRTRISDFCGCVVCATCVFGPLAVGVLISHRRHWWIGNEFSDNQANPHYPLGWLLLRIELELVLSDTTAVLSLHGASPVGKH